MILGFIGVGLILVGLAYMCYGWWMLKRNELELHPRRPRKEQPEVAILIPARDESLVIEGLLGSLRKQTVKIAMKNVFVIVESSDDPTVKICEKFGCQVILRKNLELQRKGYALDEAIRQILPKHYDLYFIFDADNTLAEDYFEQMLKYYHCGYDMVIGYRYAKNANQNIIAAMSGLTFSMINVLGNRRRVQHKANVIFSGTGCFVSGDLVEKWQGWPFHSLTEDYEMSLYAILHGIPTHYGEEAIFYDEQPTKFRQTVLQRVRWIRGYFDTRRIYVPEMKKVKKACNIGSIKRESIGVKPIILILVGVILVLANSIGSSFVEISAVWLIVGLIGLVYLVLMLMTIIMLKRERQKFTVGVLIKIILLNPLYLLTYVPCALKAIFTKDIKWEKIEHRGNDACN